MRFTIDVIYLDSSLRIIGAYENVKPWQVLPVVLDCRHVLELAAGRLAATGTIAGHRLEFVEP